MNMRWIRRSIGSLLPFLSVCCIARGRGYSEIYAAEYGEALPFWMTCKAEFDTVAERAGGYAGSLRFAIIGLDGSHIAMLFVRPEYRGRGCGRKLVEWAVARQEADSVDVNEQNPQAVGFYLRMGFSVAGRSETDDAGRPFPILHLRLEK